MLSRTVTRVVAAAALAAAAYAGIPAAPATAAPCATADGVSVVVDFHELGGGVQSGCVREGGDRFATDLFPAAGFPLAYVQRQPDFVCRVKGLPTPEQDPCVATPPATAYWSLWWADGSGGAWKYSTSNAGGLRVPDGGYVAFSWNTGSRPVPPGVAAAAHAEPKPTPNPTPTPTATPTARPTAKSKSTPTATPSASTKPTSRPKPKPTATPTPTPSVADSTSATEAASEPADSPASSASVTPTSAEDVSDDGGLPTWAAPAVIAALFAAAGVVAVLRRRRTTSGT